MDDVPGFLGGVPGFLGSVPVFWGCSGFLGGVFRVLGGVPGFLGVPGCSRGSGFPGSTTCRNPEPHYVQEQ